MALSSTQSITNELEDRIKSELQEFARKEIQNAMRDALNDIERTLTASVRSLQAGNITLTSQQNLSAGTSGSSTGALAGLFSNTVLRLIASRTKTSTSTSAATETTRSTQENTFYRESQSQRAVSISQLNSGTRNF